MSPEEYMSAHGRLRELKNPNELERAALAELDDAVARLRAAEQREKKIVEICDEFWPEGQPPYHQSTLDLVTEIREAVGGDTPPEEGT